MTTVAIDAATTETAASERIAVWDLPTRIFHWTLAASFAGAFLTAESERWRDLHVMLGYTLLGLIAFRLVWGGVGSRHARFSAFAAGPAGVWRYVRSLLAGHPERHVGHNPAGAVAIFLLLALGALVGATGWATFNDLGGDVLEEMHEGLANTMLAVVAIHVVGVVVSSFLHRENLVQAMITGDKSGPAEQGIGRKHGVVGGILLAALVAFWGAWLWGGSASSSEAAPGASIRKMFAPGQAAGGAAVRAGRHHRDGDDD